MKKCNIIKGVAMALVAIMWLGGMLGLAVYAKNASATPSTPSTAKVEVHIQGDNSNGGNTELQNPEKEEETRVLLQDVSGSMNNQLVASAGYDTVQPFSDYIGDKYGNSQIIANTVRALDMGVKELGVVSDLESYPASDYNQADGKHYQNVELMFFVSDDVKQSDLDKYKEIFSKALDQENCTLIFTMADGSKLVIFDNYNKETEEIVEEKTEAEEEKIDILVETDSGSNNGIDKASFAIVLMLLYTIIMALIEVILAVMVKGDQIVVGTPTAVPAGIQEALKKTTALDGSGSVANVYDKMVKWAKAEGVASVYRFASKVEKLSIDKAGKKTAEGNTHGWECLKQLAEEGEREITIVSDMEFNDSEITGLTFDSITFVVPAGNYSQTMLEKVAALAQTHKVIEI